LSSPKIVILCLENRSFDEYFGTFPGAVGLYDSAGSAIFQQTGFKSASGAQIPVLLPFRASTFSWAGEWIPSLDHGWDHQTSAWASGQLSGWSSGNASLTTMSYFASNDIPYHWQLAQNFLLCDNYFCSVLGPTWPNRIFLMSGTVFGTTPPQPGSVLTWDSSSDLPLIANPGGQTFAWPSFPAMLGSGASWTLYDDQNWQPPWLAWPIPTTPMTLPPAYLAYLEGTSPTWPALWDLNMLDLLQDANDKNAGIGTAASGLNYSATPPGASQSTFINDALHGNLPQISWIVPPSYLTEHPKFLPADGECYLARIVEAIMGGPDWENTILIITYDENDGHFDHVPPPTPQRGMATDEPWVTDGNGTAPVGGGYRIPAIIVSPWTYQAGVASSLVPANTYFDHTSVIQFLEQITTVNCSNLPLNPPNNWRRNTFANLGMLINTNNTPVPSSQIHLPPTQLVDQWRLDALTRLFGPAPMIGTAPPNPALPAPDPTVTQAWPPLQQQCYLIMDKTTFGEDEVDAQRQAQNDPSSGSVTFSSAFWVVVDGFDPAELNLGPLVPNAPGYIAISPQVSLTIAGTQTPPPSLQVNVGSAVADNPSLLPVPQRFRFPCDLVFLGGTSDPAFANVTLDNPELINVNASFTSRLTWNAPTEEIELVLSPDPYIQSGSVPYLSPDLRVYQVYADGQDSFFGFSLDPTNPDPLALIQNALGALNAPGSTLGSSFDVPPDPNDSAAEAAVSTVTLYPTGNNGDPTAPMVLNFAICRVTMQGLTESASNVRVFFRLFPALSTGTSYNPATLYRSTPLSGGPNPANAQVDQVTTPNPNNPMDSNNPWATRVPLLGVNGSLLNGSDILTIPFFAVERIDSTQNSLSQQPPDWPNTQAIAPATGGTGQPVYAFFGCWLDINQDGSNDQGTVVQGYTRLFPQMIPTTGNNVDGPYSSGPYQPIKAFVNSAHQCLVAEVAYDELPPIQTGSVPGDFDLLAQRNLTVQGGTN
jgi:phospholipase C